MKYCMQCGSPAQDFEKKCVNCGFDHFTDPGAGYVNPRIEELETELKNFRQSVQEDERADKDRIVQLVESRDELKRQNVALRTNAEALLFTIGAGLVPLLTKNQKQAVENLRAAIEKAGG